MSIVDIVRWIGWSHLLQPPLTLLLASPRGLDLRRSLASPSRLVGAVLENMAVASVALPTTLGLLLAWRPADVLHPGTTRDLALLLAAFWSWRLYRQARVLGPTWPPRLRALHGCLLTIFLVQGPGLASCLTWTAWLSPEVDGAATRTLQGAPGAPAQPSKPVQLPLLLVSLRKA